MTNRAAASGLIPTFNNTWSAAPVDADGDGDEDVWIGYHQASVVKGTRGAGRLFSNDGAGHYTWVARSAWPRVNANGRTTDRHDCAPADVDRDGDQDFYCSAGRNLSNRVKFGVDNELWLQDRPNHFVDVGTAWGVGDICGRGRHVAWINANGDRWPDLFVGNEIPRGVADACDGSSTLPNESSKLYLNLSGRGFRYAPDFGIVGNTGSGQRCAVVLDLEGDGDHDLLACRLQTQTPLLYRNDGDSGFTEVGAAWNLRKPDSDAVTADLNGDGRPDLLEARRRGFSYRLNTGSTFGPAITLATAGSGGSGRSVAVGDADADGDLDVYAMTAGLSGNPRDLLLVNQGGLHFATELSPPASGQADEVVALHPRGHARTEFLAMNGGGKAGGTIQLWRWQP